MNTQQVAEATTPASTTPGSSRNITPEQEEQCGEVASAVMAYADIGSGQHAKVDALKTITRFGILSSSGVSSLVTMARQDPLRLRKAIEDILRNRVAKTSS